MGTFAIGRKAPWGPRPFTGQARQGLR
ncbi:MAG: hypothetical protein LiPW39_368, partial [Parcubacteria group bacterium LiPW_39]